MNRAVSYIYLSPFFCSSWRLILFSTCSCLILSRFCCEFFFYIVVVGFVHALHSLIQILGRCSKRPRYCGQSNFSSILLFSLPSHAFKLFSNSWSYMICLFFYTHKEDMIKALYQISSSAKYHLSWSYRKFCCKNSISLTLKIAMVVHFHSTKCLDLSYSWLWGEKSNNRHPNLQSYRILYCFDLWLWWSPPYVLFNKNQ